MEEKMRLLVIMNAPWCSGSYASTPSLVLPILRDMGYHIDILANYGLEGGKGEWNGFNVWHRGDFDQSCDSVIEYYTEMLHPDIVLMHWDAWPVPATFGIRKGVRWVPWLPIDRHPLSVRVAQAIKTAYWLWPWCEDGKKALEEKGFNNLSLVPLCTDMSIFKPLTVLPDGTPASKDIIKKNMGVDGKFVVGMVAANMDYRKGIERAIHAVALLKERIPEIKLLLHAPKVTPTGLNIDFLVQQNDVRDYVLVTNPKNFFIGFTKEEMAQLYNAMDVLVLPSAGEGFGLPVLEANACGVPAISTDYTATSEVTYGALLKPVARVICPDDHSYQVAVSDEELADTIEQMYRIKCNQPEVWNQMSVEAREHASKWDVNKIVPEYIIPALDLLQERIASESDVEKWLA
jgi:glycosyltransferase involved in cell wall biosynthesis